MGPSSGITKDTAVTVYVKAQPVDPALQVDVLPDREPLAHLATPWT